MSLMQDGKGQKIKSCKNKWEIMPMGSLSVLKVVYA